MSDETPNANEPEVESAPPAPPEVGLKNRLAGAATTAKQVAQSNLVVKFLLPFASLVFVLLIIVFLGVWAGAVSGYFGERVHQDTGTDDPARLWLVAQRDASPKELGKAPNASKPNGACQLVIPDAKDYEFLKNGYEISPGNRIHPDKGLVESLKYLCERHDRLGISHLVSAYIAMKIDPEQQATRNPQVLRNISAHSKGQAYDIVEIDFVYKVFRPGICTPYPPHNFDIYYHNDRNELKLWLPCLGRPFGTNTTFQGFPAQAIPVQVGWQDQAGTFSLGGLPLNLGTAGKMLSAHFGLPAEAFSLFSGDPAQVLAQIGRGYLADLLDLPANALAGNDLTAILESAFGSRLSTLLGLEARPEWGNDLAALVNMTGAGWWEERLGLFPGSLAGWSSPEEVFRSIGLETAANILRLPSGTLTDFGQAAQILKKLTAEERTALANDPLGKNVLPIVDAVISGNGDGFSLALENYGEEVLELLLEAPRGSLRLCSEGLEDRCPDPLANLAKVAERLGLPADSLRAFVENFLSREPSFASLFQDKGLPMLETSLGLPAGSLSKILSGQGFTFDQSVIDSIANRLGVDPSLAQELLGAFQSGGSLESIIGKIGSSFLGDAFDLSDPLALFQLATGQASESLKNLISGELNSLLEQLNLPGNLVDLTKLLNGDFSSLTSMFDELAGVRLGDMFGLPLDQIQKLASGDISAFLELPAVQDLLQSALDSFGISIDNLTELFSGNAALDGLASLGSQLNGFISLFGIDQWMAMEAVYRPESRYKIHTVIKELLDMPFALNNLDLRVTQLITASHERDVAPFESDGTLNKVYGQGRSKNYGLFAMPEAFRNIHVGY